MTVTRVFSFAMAGAASVATVVALTNGADADNPQELRWKPPTHQTAPTSAVWKADNFQHVRINSTLSTAPDDRYYAFRGVTIAAPNSCGLKLVPSFLHDRKGDRNIQVKQYGCNTYTPTKTATLPDGYHVTSIQTCTDGESASRARLEGIRLWGHKLDASGRPIQPLGPVEAKKNGCREWKTKRSCPTGEIATSLYAYSPSNSVIRLLCAPVERDVGNPNPMSVTLAGASWFASTGKLKVTVRASNDSHTTAELDTVLVDLKNGPNTVCTGQVTGLGYSVVTGHTRDVDVELSCTWSQIADASHCRASMPSCSVALSGKLVARIQQITSEYPYRSSTQAEKH